MGTKVQDDRWPACWQMMDVSSKMLYNAIAMCCEAMYVQYVLIYECQQTYRNTGTGTLEAAYHSNKTRYIR
jgi:hypothetical protein